MTNPEENDADPVAEGFRDPSDQVTEPCLTYMARVMELREFISFYFQFVKTSAELRDLIPKEQTADSRDRPFELLKYDYSHHRQLVNQIMLSRAIESFDLYLTTVLRDIFLSKPQLLKSEAAVDVATVIDAATYENLIWQIVERRVHELSYKSLAELRKFVQSRTGIDLFPSEEAFHVTVIASEIRNLIAHNDCVVNEVFKSRTRTVPLTVPTSKTGRVVIDDAWLRRASYTLDGIVFRFDELASAKFGLTNLNRMTSFILRS